jgi:hypothetical protein
LSQCSTGRCALFHSIISGAFQNLIVGDFERLAIGWVHEGAERRTDLSHPRLPRRRNELVLEAIALRLSDHPFET